MRRRMLRHVGVPLVLALLVPAAGAGTALARKAPATGKLTKRGYTVIALGYDGKLASARPRPNGSFKIVPTSRSFTLQLRGKYAGPVVAGGKSRRVVVGFRAGARLGRIRLLRGYARPAGRLAARFLDRRRTALAKKGVPLGSGRNFGLVRSGGRSSAGAGRDRDLDGVPDAFDVDSDGDLVLNSVDRSAAASRARAAAGPAPPPARPPIFSQMFLDLADTVNADASGASVGQIDSTLVKFLNIKMAVPRGDLVEMDCGGLVYCSPGGPGVVSTPPEEGGASEAFPGCCDPDGDGFGNLRGPGAARLRIGPGGDELSLDPKATSTQIGSGDAFILRVTDNGTLTQTPVTIAFVFNSVPALASYDDGAGGAGTVAYPVAPGSPGTSMANPIIVRRNTSGSYVFTGTYFRPQRKGIAGAGEPSFMDIGGLRYAVQLPNVPGAPPGAPQGAPQCSPASLSTSDPNLVAAGTADMGILQDQSADRPASPSNKLTFSVDLSRCVADKGGALGPGMTFGVHPEAFAAGDSADHALQTVWLQTQ